MVEEEEDSEVHQPTKAVAMMTRMMKMATEETAVTTTLVAVAAVARDGRKGRHSNIATRNRIMRVIVMKMTKVRTR